MRKRLAIIILFVCRSIFSFAQYFETDTTFIPFKKGDKFVYCNPKGKVLINTRFDYAEPFSSGFAIVGKKDAKRDLLYGVIDKKGLGKIAQLCRHMSTQK